MKKLQTMKSLSLMSTKPMGLFQLKKGGILSFSEMILKRTNPIFLSIKNDTVRFFLKQQGLENSVVHHHLYKEEIENSFLTNYNNFKSEKNLKVRDILYLQRENVKENSNTFISKSFNFTNNTYNKVETVDKTKISTSKFHKKSNHEFSTIKQQNTVSNQKYENTINQNIENNKGKFPAPVSILNMAHNFKQNEIILNSQKYENTINQNIENNKEKFPAPVSILNISHNSKQNKIIKSEEKKLNQNNILSFYQYEYKKALDTMENSLESKTVVPNIARFKPLVPTLEKNLLQNAISSINNFTSLYKQIDMHNNTDTHNIFEKKESSKNYHNYKSDVEISYKKELVKNKKEEIEKSPTLSNNHKESQESHMLNSPLVIKNGVEMINNEETTTIINNIEEKLIQTVSCKVMEKVEAMWSREIMRRGGDYGR